MMTVMFHPSHTAYPVGSLYSKDLGKWILISKHEFWPGTCVILVGVVVHYEV